MFLATSQAFNLPPGLLSAVCYVESKHTPSAINHDDGNGDSIGLCQIKHGTAVQMGYKGSLEGLKDPATNTFYAARFLAYQQLRYHNDYIKAIAAYNAGSARLDENGQVKNKKYVEKVFKAWHEGR